MPVGLQPGRAASGLWCAGIVHRDIKLENLLLAGRDTLDVKLADFGLCKDVRAGDPLRTCCGSPAYIAPEIIAAQTTHQARTAGPCSGTRQPGCCALWCMSPRSRLLQHVPEEGRAGAAWR